MKKRECGKDEAHLASLRRALGELSRASMTDSALGKIVQRLRLHVQAEMVKQNEFDRGTRT